MKLLLPIDFDASVELTVTEAKSGPSRAAATSLEEINKINNRSEREETRTTLQTFFLATIETKS